MDTKYKVYFHLYKYREGVFSSFLSFFFYLHTFNFFLFFFLYFFFLNSFGYWLLLIGCEAKYIK